MSQAEENYLKAIYTLQTEFGKSLSTNIIAAKIDTKASSVTDMLKKLSLKKLVIYKKYQGAHLTKKGNDLAIKVIRKHRLWETFLVNKLDFNWNEVHDIAEQLEHIKSDVLMAKLDAFLGHPKQDPHGTPIPDREGVFPEIENDYLANIPKDTLCVLVGVKNSPDVFLNYLNSKNIAINSTIKVLNIEPFDKSMRIEINTKELLITGEVAKNLQVIKQ